MFVFNLLMFKMFKKKQIKLWTHTSTFHSNEQVCLTVVKMYE